MISRLHYFYQLTKKNIRALNIAGIIFYLCLTIFSLFNMIIQKDNYFDFGLDSELHIGIRILYCYLGTKHIDFALYVRAWMFGYQVYHKFENMSYLITSSCIYKNDDDNSVDSEEDIDFRHVMNVSKIFQNGQSMNV